MGSLLEIQHLTFSYLGSDKPAIADVNLRIDKGDSVGLIGPTGCGKSTLFYCIIGIIPHWLPGHTKGDVFVDGMNTKEHAVSELAQKVGILYQDPDAQLFTTSVEQEVAFPIENLGLPRNEIIERIDKALSMVKMKTLTKRKPTDLSGGQKQRVALASVLAMNPDLLILDEPTSDLDPVGSREVMSIIKELQQKGKTIFLIEHKIDEIAEFVNNLLVMDEGKIVAAGDPHEVLSNVGMLHSIGVRAPWVTELFHRARFVNHRLGYPIVTPEAISRLENRLDESLCQGFSTSIVRHNVGNFTPRPVIRVRDLRYKYPEGEAYALDAVNVDIYKNESVAIIGENGSGKTTLVRHFVGLNKPTSGSVYVLHNDVSKSKISQLARHVGFVFQNPEHQLFADTVEQEVSFGPRNIGIAETEIEKLVKQALEVVGAPDLWTQYPHSLSRGQKRRVAVASILAMAPSILVLDEPTTGQDFMGIKMMMSVCEKLKTEGRTIIFITHDMQLVAEHASRVLVMKDGQIAMDAPPEQIFSLPKEQLEFFGLEKPSIGKISSWIRDRYGNQYNEVKLEQVCKSLMAAMKVGP